MIELRDVVASDKETMRQWRNLPEVSKYMLTSHEISHEEHSVWFDNMLKDNRCRYWIVMLDSEAVGVANIAGIDLRHSRCSLGFYLPSPQVRGKGVGSFVEYSILDYVFERMKLNKLCAEVIRFNKVGIGIHKKFGFVEEGLLRQHIMKQGTPHDVVCLSMLRSEWKTLKADLKARLLEKGIVRTTR
ncbi:MAG: UDP-4-amino-4,6-dideoxy-N-acetyl-beta-L-altrosamine N-acetyltransferase [Myxococcota bacterium]|nr:UDP-4-amino-4,6-dideoxy-N-acetyl-beta-L-altrosamine N-acetyltransferase [Myxococcota bacterium]